MHLLCHGVESYRRILGDTPKAIANSFLFSMAAVVLITAFSALISDVIVLRENVASGAIGFVTTFRSGSFDIAGTAGLLVLIHFIRRLPYGMRSTTLTLRQNKPSLVSLPVCGDKLAGEAASGCVHHRASSALASEGNQAVGEKTTVEWLDWAQGRAAELDPFAEGLVGLFRDVQRPEGAAIPRCRAVGRVPLGADRV